MAITWARMAELASRIPIRHYIDHGGNVQPAAAVDAFLQNVYPGLIAKSKHTVAKAGDVLPLKGVEWRFVTSARETITSPLPGAGRPNPHCAGFTPHTVNPVSGGPIGNTEDEHSVGSHVTFGKFRALYLADFPWNKEFDLMCPNNRLGTVDFLLVSRHGQHSSNSAALVHALRPRVGVINNGIRKGGQPETMRVLHSSPGLEDLWQVSRRAVERRRVRDPGNLRRQHRRRSAAQSGALDKGVGAVRRLVHGDEQPQRVQQDLRLAVSRGVTPPER